MTFTLNLSHSYRNPFLHPHSEWHAACSKYGERKGKEEIASESELQQSTVHLHLKHLRMTFIYFYLGPPLFVRKSDSKQFQGGTIQMSLKFPFSNVLKSADRSQ